MTHATETSAPSSLTQAVMTRNADIQAARTGVTAEILDLVYSNADIELPQYQGRRSIRISRQKSAELADTTPFVTIEQAQRVELIITAEGKIVAVHRCDPYPARRRLRTGRRRSFARN